MIQPKLAAQSVCQTVTGAIDQRCDELGDELCLVVGDAPLTYRELRDRSIAAANAFIDLGLQPGDTIGIFAETSPEWLYAWFGAARMGAVSVPINTAYRGEYLANPLRDSSCRLILADENLTERLVAVSDDLPQLETVMIRRMGTGGPDLGWRVLDSGLLLEGNGSVVATGHSPEWQDRASVLYTSGTTGPSKGAMISHNYLVSAAATMVDSWALTRGDVLYAPLPLFHISAVASVMGPILAGGTGVLDARFSVRACWDRVRQFEAAGILLAGVMVNMLWNLPPDRRDADLPLRFISTAPIPHGLRRPVEERYGLKVLTSYGMTEALPMTLYGMGDEVVEGASGRAAPNFDVQVLDEHDRPVAPGVVGEICCRPRSPHVMFDGYYGQPAATVEAWRNLWFHSGDLGRLDEAGHLTYVDRRKDAMRRRGENISSFEVEQTILRHPAIAEAAAIGVSSEIGEDDVKLVLSLKPKMSVDFEELMAFCVERLPYFAVPRYLEFVDHLPMNETGKVLKSVLRSNPVNQSTWDREAAGYVVTR